MKKSKICRLIKILIIVPTLLLSMLLPNLTVAEEVAASDIDQGLADWTIQVGALSIYWQVYEGSDEFESLASPYISAEYKDRYFIDLIDGIGVNFRNDEQVRLAASIAYITGRDESDSDNLQGIGDINDGAALNLLSEYRFGKYSIGGKFINQLSGDNTGFVVDASAGYTSIIANTTVVKTALIASVASSRYTESYFGINDTQAAASGLDSYKPGAGVKSAGLQVDVLRAFANHWNLLGQVKYERLLGDTADSPIVLDENQYTVAIGAAYQF